MKYKKYLFDMKFVYMCITVAMSLCFLLPNNAGAQGGDTSSGGLKIGVVDLNIVFEKYEKRKKYDADLREEEKSYQTKINDKKKELVSLKDKIQLMDLGSQDRKKYEEEFERKNIELESYAKVAEKSLMRKYKESFELLYSEVLKEIEAIGRQNRYDLIIKKEEAELQSGGISEMQFKVGIKTVLYHSDAVDITNQVINLLNKKYSKADKGK
ncbi:MAG: OmpH family outer membrane protein [Candidatus Kuenenia sp.]|nr:OmpH family outer membrane protein [Candidatus Kuenenia hertensis]